MVDKSFVPSTQHIILKIVRFLVQQSSRPCYHAHAYAATSKKRPNCWTLSPFSNFNATSEKFDIILVAVAKLCIVFQIVDFLIWFDWTYTANIYCTTGLWFLQISPVVQRSVTQTFKTFQMLIWIMPIFPRLKRCASQEMALCLLHFWKWQWLNAKNTVKEHTACRVKIVDHATIITIYFFSAKALYTPHFLSNGGATNQACYCLHMVHTYIGNWDTHCKCIQCNFYSFDMCSTFHCNLTVLFTSNCCSKYSAVEWM